MVEEYVAVAEDRVIVRDTDVAHVHGQTQVACGMLQTAKRHHGCSHVVVVEVAVVAVISVAVIVVVVVAVAVDVSVAQEQRQTWKVWSMHAARRHQGGSQVVVSVLVVSVVLWGVVEVAVDEVSVAV